LSKQQDEREEEEEEEEPGRRMRRRIISFFLDFLFFKAKTLGIGYPPPLYVRLGYGNNGYSRGYAAQRYF
jgi:hypothetical protein